MRAFRYCTVASWSEAYDCRRVPPAQLKSLAGEGYPLPREPGPLSARLARTAAAAAARDGGGDGVVGGGGDDGGGAFCAVDDAAGGASVGPVLLPSCHRPQNFRDKREKETHVAFFK